MKTQAFRACLRASLPTILALALPALLAAQAKLEVHGLDMTIRSGSGPSAWQLRYGTKPANTKPQLILGADQRAWFAHGSWLRLIDTGHGIVLGRWWFPGLIVKLNPQGRQVRVEFEDTGMNAPHEVVLFDPDSPRIPEYPNGDLVCYGFGSKEARSSLYLDAYSLERPISPEKAKAALPGAADMVRRDPFSPWLRVTLAQLLRAAGDPAKSKVLEEAIRQPNLLYLELWPISSHLDQWGEPDLAREAFERGYRDFLDRGYDPRLNGVLIARLLVYPPADWKRLSPAQREEQTLRTYRFGPGSEMAKLAWVIHIRDLERAGRTEEARAWQARLEDAAKYGSPFFDNRFTLDLDHCLLVIGATVLALILFVVHLHFRYGPQRRLDAAQKAPRMRLFGAEYWSPRERGAFLAISLVFMLAVPVLTGVAAGMFNAFRAPLSVVMGSLAGPNSRLFLESLPSTQERELLRALSAQQDGDKAKAERLYRELPDFAESWNNLGVILKGQGKEAEAKQAFERALKLDSQLAESALNLGRPPADLWTTQYYQDFPGRLMIAPPRGERIWRALSGGSLLMAGIRATAHPIALMRLARGGMDSILALVWVGFFGMLLAFIVAILLVFVIPQRDVTEPPAKGEWIWATLFPGLGSESGILGAPVLLAWCYMLIQLALFKKFGTPYLITSISLPSMSRAFGVSDVPIFGQLGGLNPDWGLMYAAPALLFAVNALLVFRNRGK